MTSSPLVLAIVPATSASSTIDKRLSLSSSSSSTGIISGLLGGRDELGKPRPCRGLVHKRRRVGGARRGEIDQCQMRGRLADQPAADGRRGRSVERDRAKVRVIVEQMLDLIVFGLAD